MDTKIKQVIRYLLTEGTKVSDKSNLPEQTENWTYDELVQKLTTEYGKYGNYSELVSGSSFILKGSHFTCGSSFILKDGKVVHLNCSHEEVMRGYYDVNSVLMVSDYNDFLKKFQIVRVYISGNGCGITFSGKITHEQFEGIKELADQFKLSWKDSLWGSNEGEDIESLEYYIDDNNLLESALESEKRTYDELVYKLTTEYGEVVDIEKAKYSMFILQDGRVINLNTSHRYVMGRYYHGIDFDGSLNVDYTAFLKQFQLVRVFSFGNHLEWGVEFGGKITHEQFATLKKASEYDNTITWYDRSGSPFGSGEDFDSLEYYIDDNNLLESKHGVI